MAFCRSFVALLTLSAVVLAQDSPAPSNPPPADNPPPSSPKVAPESEPGAPRPSGRFGPGGPHPDGKGRPDWKSDRGDRGKREKLTPDQMRERAMSELEKLTPEQRMEVWRSVWAVLNLPQEKRLELIGMEDDRRKQVREEIDRTLQTTGIKIADDQKRKFFHRYFTGRREIEEQLKKEGEARRQVLMKELDEKLKTEFGAVQNP